VLLVRRLVALVVAGLLGVLTSAAYADPPDPCWLGGYWDDDDFDTGVDLLTGAPAISTPAVAEVKPVLESDERVELGNALVRFFALRTLAFPRAPPTSTSSSS
jgi:hypothetical protein